MGESDLLYFKAVKILLNIAPDKQVEVCIMQKELLSYINAEMWRLGNFKMYPCFNNERETTDFLE